MSIAAALLGILPFYADGKVKYLLWALIFLKIYEKEQIFATLTGCEEKSFRKWSKTYIYPLADISTVRTVVRTSTPTYKLGKRYFGITESLDEIYLDVN